MGMDAEVIVIGPKGVLELVGVLDYAPSYYDGVHDEALVLGTVVVAWTSGQSRLLAGVCGVKPWDLGNHKVTEPVQPIVEDLDEQIGDSTAGEVYPLLYALLGDKRVQMWYRPNG